MASRKDSLIKWKRRRRRARIKKWILLIPFMIVAGVLSAYLAMTVGHYWLQLALATGVALGFPLEIFRGERKGRSFWIGYVVLLAAHLTCCIVFELPEPQWRPKELTFLAVVEAGAVTFLLAKLMGVSFDPKDYTEDQQRQD